MLTPEQIAAIVAAIGAPKLLIRLIDTVQQGVGVVSAPYFARKNAEALADAEAYRIKKIAACLEEIDREGLVSEYKDGHLVFTREQLATTDLDNRYLLRSEYQGKKKQENVEAVTSAAVEEILSDQDAEGYSSEQPVDPDWISKFFNAIEDVSDGEMQRLWGKVLAGEIKQPSSYSHRTLEFLKTLSKAEAEVFAKVAQYSATGAGKEFVGDFQRENLEDKWGISFMDILTLKEIGILLPESLVIKFSCKETPSSFVYQGHVVVFEHQEELRLQALVFSKTGAELLKLLPIKFNREYLEHLLEPIKNKTSTLWFARITEIKDDSISFEDESILK